jgi:adenylate cyclase
VRGKAQSIDIYELICLQTQLTDSLKNELAIFHAILELYFKQQWDEALTSITLLSNEHPHKKLYRLYLDRINEFKISPPPEDWDGVHVHSIK